jgi:hypothetical protein
LALFARTTDMFCLGDNEKPLEHILWKSLLSRGAIHVGKEMWPKLREILQSNIDPHQDWNSRFRVKPEDPNVFVSGADLLSQAADFPPDLPDTGPFLLFVFAPDPLVHNLAGMASPTEPV